MSENTHKEFLENDSSKNELKIECVHCATENNVKLSKSINCKNCDKVLTGNNVTYKFSKSAAVIGMLGGVAIGAVLEDKNLANSEIISIAATGAGMYAYTFRLKLESEYKIMKTCIDKFGSTAENRDKCFCVVKKLSTYLNSLLVKEKGEEWIDEQLDEQYGKCSENKDN